MTRQTKLMSKLFFSGKMLIIGGLHDKGTLLSKVEQYTINLDTSKAIYETKANMQKPR